MRLEDGLARLTTENKELFALMCALLGRGTREVEERVQSLEEALVARYGEPRQADAPRSVLRLWWYGLVSASAAPRLHEARAASLLFLGQLNAHAGVGCWQTLSEGLELAGVELSHARLTEAGGRTHPGVPLNQLERALLGSLVHKRRVGALELITEADDPVAALLALRRLEARGQLELFGDAFVALSLKL